MCWWLLKVVKYKMKERSAGLIIGISIGVVIGAVSALTGLFCFWYHRKRPQIGNSSSRRAATIPIRANGVDTCTILSDSSMGTESSRKSVQNHGTPLWFGLKKGHVIAASGILEYSYKYVEYSSIVLVICFISCFISYIP